MDDIFSHLRKKILTKFQICNTLESVLISDMGPSIKSSRYFAQFLPSYPCHTSSHIPGPPKVRHTSRTPRIFKRPSAKNPDKSPLVQMLSQLRWDGMAPWLSRLLSTGGSWVRLPL